MARPKSLLWFDWLFAVLIMLILINAVLRWRMATDIVRGDSQIATLGNGNADAFLAAGFTVVIAGLTLMWWLTSRRRSRIAAVVLVTIFLTMAIIGIFNFATQAYSWQLTMWSSAAQIAVYIMIILLLLLPSTRRWFANNPDNERLEETFS